MNKIQESLNEMAAHLNRLIGLAYGQGTFFAASDPGLVG